MKDIWTAIEERVHKSELPNFMKSNRSASATGGPPMSDLPPSMLEKGEENLSGYSRLEVSVMRLVTNVA